MATTTRNKSNPFFAKKNHVRLPKYSKTKALVDTTGADVNTEQFMLTLPTGEALTTSGGFAYVTAQ